ncbi:uracil-DNA glycosylase family protein [Xylanibacter muris]|uniref:Uracil-DNA glycosylase family protein n=1 Tax=Xylanibacter muris TaxID=2736290 RepID=A0ABX2AMF9_9BACT|nr:uracil-DNA glycosylase family protein [Xylanibacter muris]NPD91375.1 uracil-DNA glycosylase family protein [Xylanibacter muris]
MDSQIEAHPFEPFLPDNARLLMLGTFPPAAHRWCMRFYYPNFTNDMWRIFGVCFYGDKMHFVRQEEKTYDLDAIKPFLVGKGIAMYDTAAKVIRTRNTASDKDLRIVEPADLDAMLCRLRHCVAVITAGQLATEVFCRMFGISVPKVGEYSEFEFVPSSDTGLRRIIRLYRMPSSSRAYPMKVENKAAYYNKVFAWLRML